MPVPEAAVAYGVVLRRTSLTAALIGCSLTRHARSDGRMRRCTAPGSTGPSARPAGGLPAPTPPTPGSVAGPVLEGEPQAARARACV